MQIDTELSVYFGGGFQESLLSYLNLLYEVNFICLAFIKKQTSIFSKFLLNSTLYNDNNFRRKPQNLTPPGSSDGGSSGSGHSPTSTHPGSPPPPISSSKRPGYYDGVDGLPTKRPRISHYLKPSEPIYRPPIKNDNQRRPVTDSRDASNMNPRSRESPPNCYNNSLLNGYSNGLHIDKRNSSDEEDNANRKRVCDSHSLNHGVNYEKTFNKESSNRLSPAKNFDRNRIKDDVVDGRTSNNEVLLNGRFKEDSEEREHKQWNKISSNSYSRLSQASPNNQSETINATDSGPPRSPDDGKETKSAFPDYLT